METEITREQIATFLQGRDEQKYIVKIEGDYNSETMAVIYYDEETNVKKIAHEPFYPFCWCKLSAAQSLFGGDRTKLKIKLQEYGISCIGLRVANNNGEIPERMKNGYNIMFKARRQMSYSKFQQFFREGNRPLYAKMGDPNYGLNEYVIVNPIEQYMIQTSKRLFKGYNDYNDLNRMQFDLETDGLDPKTCLISQIGIRTNKGFEKIIPILGEGEEKYNNEIKGLNKFFQIIRELKPDVISGHNSENFDWYFIDERLKIHGTDLEEFTASIFPRKGIYKSKKKKVLKLGGEMEYYSPTVMWGTNITDSLFAVRRAQALNSDIKKADLKYITKFAKLNKPNRVYVPGKIINSTWEDVNGTYAFNDNNGNWFKFDDEKKSKTFTDENGNVIERYTLTDNSIIDNQTNETFQITNGRYIVERYLLDDIYETDKVELSFNQTNFQVSKMLPVPFEKMCTMGTAAIWKYIMCSWSYENNLAIPDLIEKRKFTGGLSRLLVTGYVKNILKLDYNSLYPSIILTHNINTEIDIMGVMSMMLEYILTTREEYKGEKKKADKEVRRVQKIIDEQCLTEELKQEIDKFKSKYTLFDNMQSSVKVIGNAFFGSYGCGGGAFPWSDLTCAEETTCTGRMALRLMISWFNKLGYRPLVGDSFLGDTPLFIKYKNNNMIDIKPISELIDKERITKDILGREYDNAPKDFYVLCRSGWVEPEYIYRHKTDKDIYTVRDNDAYIQVTEDHSLFDSEKKELKPSQITKDTKLEYKHYDDVIFDCNDSLTDKEIDKWVNFVCKFNYKLPIQILNSSKETRNKFMERLLPKLNKEININNFSKTFVAGINFLNRK